MLTRLRDNAVLAFSLLLAASMLLLALWPESRSLLGFERYLIAGGQYWRWITGHIVHLNFNHAFMNSAGLLVLGLYFRHDFSLRAWLGLMLAAAAVISSLLWWYEPDVTGYAGFSGILHALLFAGLLRTWRELPWLNSMVLLLMVARLVWEQSAAYNPYYLMDVIQGRVIPMAHLGGALTGLAWGLGSLYRRSDGLPLPSGGGADAATPSGNREQPLR